MRGLAIASVDRLDCDKSEVAADARPGRCSGLSPRIAHGQRLEEVPDAADGGLAQDDLK